MVTSGRTDAIEIENRFHCHDGTYRWLRWHLTVDRGERLLYCLAQDISDWKAGDGSPDSAARYGLMFDTTDAIAVTDADAILTYVSAACLPLLGYAPEELVGKPIAGLIHPEDRSAGGDSWTASCAHGRDKQRQPALPVERLALTDALTGLANRLLLSDRLNQCLRRLKRTPGLVGVLMLDLDHFKVINDTLGHQVGDAVLVAAAHRLQRLARPDDTVARFGGDEFVVIVQALTKAADLSALADRIVTALREPYRVGNEEVVITVSVGIAVTSQADHLPGDLLREADLAEEAGLLPTMDDWVRATALTQLSAWRSGGASGLLGRVAVNVTARELASADFASRLASRLGDAGLDGHDLTIEVTEHVLLQTSNSAINSLVELRSLGVHIGLDDFGTGFSALAYLQAFPLDFLKIDRSFVERINHDSRSSSIIAAIIGLAHALDLAVVAEGVESEEQLAALRSFGCDRVQGFLLSRPLPTAEFGAHLEAQRS